MEVEARKENRNQRTEEDTDISNTALPHDIMLDILLRLPAKSLGQFKFVSKSWYKVIGSTFFTNMHKKLYNSCRGKLVIKKWDNQIYTIDIQELNQSSDAKKLRFLGRERRMRCESIWGSSNGLVCIQLSHVFGPESCLYLWNPFTMEYRQIPRFKRHPLYTHTIYGFGHNFTTDDYEIVEIACIEDQSSSFSAVNVFSVCKNSWRTHLDIPYNLSCTSCSGVQCNGAFHWVALPSDIMVYERECYYPLIAYDPRGETCREIALPDSINGTHSIIRVLREKLWIRHKVDFWVMNEYGVQDSWTKLLNISDIPTYYPLCSTDCGFICSGMNDNLILYDPEKNSCSEIQGISNINEVIYCMESIQGCRGQCFY